MGTRCIGGVLAALGALLAVGVAPATAEVTFTQSAYTLASYNPSKGVGSSIGSSSPPAQKPLAVADMNGDGRPDIVVSDYEAKTIHVFLNNGAGAFAEAPGSPYTTEGCYLPDSVLPGDFNGDGTMDVLVECAGEDTIALFPGTGGGALGVTTAYVTGTGPMFIANIDADTDVVYKGLAIGACTLDIENFKNSGNQDALRLCQGGDEWGSSVHWFTSGCGGDEWLGFGGLIGGDRALELIAGAKGDEEHLFACETASTHEWDSGIPLEVEPSDLSTPDMNGDGIPDIVISDYGNPTVGSFHIFAVSTASGVSLSAPAVVPSVHHISAFAVADFNGDGKADLAGAEYGPNFNSSNLIVIHLGHGDASQFDPPQPIPVFGDNTVSTYPRAVVSDLNGDGRPDIVTNGLACNIEETECSDKVTVLLNGTPPPASGGTGETGGGTGGGGVPKTVFVGILLHGGTLKVKNGVVTLQVSCPASAQTLCAGRVTLGTLKAFAARVRHKRKVTLGSAAFSVPAGHKKTVKIRLTAKGLKLLAKKHTLVARETIAAHDASGQSKTTAATVKLKLVKKKHRKH